MNCDSIIEEKGDLFMFFKRKPKVDLDTQFKQLYKETNKITADAGNELDFVIKYSQLELACRNYDRLLEMIDQGAHFDKAHFASLKESVEEEAKRVKGIIDED